MQGLLEPIWHSNRDSIRKTLISLTRDIDLADDLLQETFMRAHDGISGYRGGDARAWLNAIARNVFYNHARRKSYNSESSLEAMAIECQDMNWRAGSEDHINILALRRAIAEMEPPIRIAVLMKYYGGCSYEEIADYLGCSATIAKQRIWRAVRRLRRSLEVGQKKAKTRHTKIKRSNAAGLAYG